MCMILYDNTWILDDIGIMINDYTLLYIYTIIYRVIGLNQKTIWG